MRGVVGWLRPGSRFAFQRQVRQMHRMHRTQDIIFADAAVGQRRDRVRWNPPVEGNRMV